MILKKHNVEKDVTNERTIRELKSDGWIVVWDKSAEVPEVFEEPKNYSEMLKAELVKEAEAKGIKVHGMKKADLIKALEG